LTSLLAGLEEPSNPDFPILTNLRLDAFEQPITQTHHRPTTSGLPTGFGVLSLCKKSWEIAKNFLESPPMRKSASINVDSVKEQIAKHIAVKNAAQFAMST